MSSWIMKAALQNLIGRLPRSYWWNGLLQKYVTRVYYPSRETFESKLGCCRQHLDNYLKFSLTPRTGFKALELGTGTWPIVPIGLFLLGASEIWTYDLVPVLRRDNLKRTMELFYEFRREGALERILGRVQGDRLLRVEEVLGQAERETPVQLLSRMNIHVRVGDARNTALPDRSVDLIFSTVVLEMINGEILNGLFGEFKRVASPGAVMSHYVGLIDQYSSFDKSITPYNFLKYSDKQWSLLNNPVIPHSRLRIADYRELLELTGWDIAEERSISGSLNDLKRIRLAPKFRKYAVEDLLILSSWLVAQPS